MAKLLSGSGLAFLIGYLSKPIILRLFPVADFGIYDFVISLVAVAMPVASLRYEDAMVLPEDDRESRSVLLLSLLLTSVTSLALAAAIYLLGDRVSNPDARIWLWSVPIILFVMRLGKIGELWATRRHRFGLISAATAGQSSVTTASRIAAGWSGTGTGGLLGSFLAGHVLLAALFGRTVWRTLPRGGPLGLWATAGRYRRFPLFSTPAALVSALGTRLPFLVLMSLFGAEVLGLFGQAFNILFVPLSLVGTAVAQVFFVRAADAHRSGDLTGSTREAYALLTSVAVAPLMAVCAGAPVIFGFLFGTDWVEAGRYAVWIAPWIALTAVASPLTRVFDVTERQRLDLALSTFIFLLLAAALGLASLGRSPVQTMMLLGAAGTAGRAVQIVVACRIAGMSTLDILLPYVRPLMEGTVLFLLVALAASTLTAALTTLVCGALLLLWSILLIRRLSD